MLSLLIAIVVRVEAQQFDTYFEDRTLRVDYIFSGDNRHQQIALDELHSADGWYGRRVNLDHLLLRGNGQIVMTDTLGRDTLYIHSFSTLFQEWQTTEEATRLWRSFENVFLLPMPRTTVNIEVTLTDTHNRVTSRMLHRVNPKDILVRPLHARDGVRWKYLRQSGESREKIDVAFVAEGYRRGEMRRFYRDCQESIDALLDHEPFRSMADRFNFIAVASPSMVGLVARITSLISFS